ncbi:hypothetical protein ACFL6U_28860, partial [Planctomycetota bacterium]
ELTAGLFVFRHLCGSTIAVKAEAFMDLCEGPFFKENRAQTAGCPEYCLTRNELRPCPNECECASVRELLPILNNYRDKVNQDA